jgi:dihydroflavonol-4-reductase
VSNLHEKKNTRLRVLVTGASGFIGSHLIDLLCEKKYEVVCFIKKGENTRWLDHKNIQIRYGDITDKKSIESVIDGPFHYIYHLAGVMKTDKPQTYYKVNAEGTRNLVEVCIEKKVPLKRLVYTSSAAASGPSSKYNTLRETDECRPVTDYGKSKLEAERVLFQYSERIPFTILRPTLVYGPRNPHGIFAYFQFAARGFKPNLGDGMANLIYVKDLIRALVLAVEIEEAKGRVYLVGEQRIYSFKELGDTISGVIGRKTFTVRIPTFVLFASGALLQTIANITHTRPLFDLRRARDMNYRYWRFDTSKIERELGFFPVYSLRDGVKETVRWYRREGWIK